MSAEHLIDNYSYSVDTSSVVFCLVLLILVRYVLYFSNDKKSAFLKRSVLFVLIGASSNILFGLVCENFPEADIAIYVCRSIHHTSLMCCMYTYILYIKDMLDIKGRLVVVMSYVTRTVVTTFLVLDIFSWLIHFGLYKAEDGWHDAIISFYNAFYVYGILMLFVMLVFYNKRLIRTVRTCLVFTELLIIIIMIYGGVNNTSTYTSFTYLLPIVVVMMLLHSKPYDDETGAMSSRSLDFYIDRYVKKGNLMNYLVLHVRTEIGSRLPKELGKGLRTFWNGYFNEASFFMLDAGVYVLAVPEISKNENNSRKIRELFFHVFPQYYHQFKLPYKIIALSEIDFINTSQDLKNILNYLFMTMEENSSLVADDKLKKELKLMRSIKDQLEDIERTNDMNDERVIAFCQPILNMNTGKYDTAEALMRLSIPEQEMVPPGFFIPLAENYDHIHILTKIMLNKVCRSLKKLEEEGYVYKRVSVNVAMSELKSETFCSEILEIIESNGINPSKIGIELTESQNEMDFILVRNRISYLKELGMTIYLDDFGTGYSNLERIIRLGLDVIKYDRSILLAAEKDDNAYYMIKHFAEAFRKFDYKLLFEGIESANQEQICSACGADYLQGFKFAKPIPIEQLVNYLTKVTDV